MEIVILLMFFIMGTALGSFVNMLVFRTAVAYGLKKGKVRPKYTDKRSVCDHCGRQLSWRENIPVISWVILGGKSKCCATPLPYQYPLVELSGGILTLSAALKFLNGDIGSATLILTIGLVTMLILETVFDLKYMILPDYATGIMALMIIIIGLITGQDLISSLGGAAIGAGVIGGIYLATRGRGMGLGDVKLMPVLGWWLGWQLTIVALYLAFIGGAMVGLVLLAAGKVKRKQPIPFGPFLMMGAYAAWWGATSWLALIKNWF